MSVSFACSYLANDMEEDVDDYKLTIVPYALVDAHSRWSYKQYKRLLWRRDRLFMRMHYCAFVHHSAIKQVQIDTQNSSIRVL